MNANGRVLQDVFIYPLHPSHQLRTRLVMNNTGNPPAFLIEADADQMPNLYRFLKKYKLRASLTMRVLEEEEMAVYAAWNDFAGVNPERVEQPSKSYKENTTRSDLLVAPDPRTPAPWSRILAPAWDNARLEDSTGLDEVSEKFYHLKRYLNGVPEGQKELLQDSTILHEANIDLMQGVDFRKGCYVGQELVIRTQHIGVVRKRVMPVQFWMGQPPTEAELKQKEPVFSGDLSEVASTPPNLESWVQQHLRSKVSRSRESRVGRFLGGFGNVGLALCRLENVIELEDGVAKGRTRVIEMDMDKLPETSAGAEPVTKAWVRPFVPAWWKERGEYKEGGYENFKARALGRKDPIGELGELQASA